MHLKSNAFKNGGRIPRRFTCDGENISPALAWTGAPPDAESFAIVCSDSDAPAGTWYHWGIYNLPRMRRELKEGPADSDTAEREAINDFGDRGYGGPCPPHSHGNHRYLFTIYALNTAKLDIAADADCRALERAAKSHALVTAEFVGLYGR